jgi:hypothetical protein
MELDSGRSTSRFARNRLALETAEQIAASADRLEKQAAQVRSTDKHLALQILKEATKLRKQARTLDIQHKRAVRAMMERLRGNRDYGPEDAPRAG